MDAAIAFIEATALHTFIVSHSWIWPTLEMIHFLGLCLLLGSLLIVDLSVIGFAPSISLRLVDKFIIATLIGFALNAITGSLFVVGDPGRYFINIAFHELSVDARISTALSLTLWTSVIVLGRFIPYVEDL